MMFDTFIHLASLVDGSVLELMSNATIMPIDGGEGLCVPTGGGDEYYHGSAFHAITAAFATVGYFIQADLLYFIVDGGGMQYFAPLVYIIAAAGGLVMMAMGQPPKNYLWFFIGPAVYWWLLTPVDTFGVRWMIGDQDQDQTEVWKHAEIGLYNSNLVLRSENFPATVPTGPIQIRADQAPSNPVVVAAPFLIWDSLTSDLVRNLTSWTGVLRQDWNDQAGSLLRLEGPGPLLDPEQPYTSSGFSFFGFDFEFTGPNPWEYECSNPGGPDGDPRRAHFALMTNMKWSYLHDITSARLSSPDMRDALGRFMANECGESFFDSISDVKFKAAAHTKGEGLPISIFLDDDDSFGAVASEYKVLRKNLGEIEVPFPESLRSVFANRERHVGNDAYDFVSSMKWDNSSFWTLWASGFNSLEHLLSRDRLSCEEYLHLLVLYMRYEAGAIFAQSFGNSLPRGWTADHAVYNLLYGWDVFPRGLSGTAVGTVPVPDQHRFVQDLILVHIIRNEMANLPSAIETEGSASGTVIENAELYNATVGSVNKFAEVYTWALMIPYMQGILLYLLAIAYPFVCILVLIPGWHKIIFTWGSFWLWAKLWDLGFAIVASLERTIWASLGNNSDFSKVSQRVIDMQEHGAAAWYGCVDTGGTGASSSDVVWGPTGDPFGCTIAKITLVDGPVASGATAYSLRDDHLNLTNIDWVADNLRLMDLSMLIGANLDLDLANGYYIYIMAALYFAVPAVTGQLVLGAKAGAAQFADKFTSDPARGGAQGAQQGFQGEQVQQLRSNAATVSQASTAAGHRKSGLVGKALGFQNMAAEEGMRAAALGQAAEGERAFGDAALLSHQTNQRMLDMASAMASLPLSARNKDVADEHRRAFAAERSGGFSSPVRSSSPRQGGESTATDPSTNPSDVAGGDPLPGGGTQAMARGSNGQPLGFGNYSGFRQDRGARAGDSFRTGTQGTGQVEPLDMWGRVGNVSQGAAQIYQGTNIEGALDVAKAAWNANNLDNANLALNNARAEGMHAGIQGFAANQRSSGYRAGAERTMAEANFNAASNRYNKMNSMANQLAGRASVLGGPAGMLDPGQRPEDAMGMAMTGMLNTNGRNGNVRAMGQYFDPSSGQFFGQVSGTQNRLNQQYGREAVRDRYQASNAGAVFYDAIAHAAPTEVGRVWNNSSHTGNTAQHNGVNSGRGPVERNRDTTAEND